MISSFIAFINCSWLGLGTPLSARIALVLSLHLPKSWPSLSQTFFKAMYWSLKSYMSWNISWYRYIIIWQKSKALDNSTSGKNAHENQPPSEGYYHLDSETKMSFDYVPETALSYIHSVATKQQKLFKILLDTGTSASLIQETILTDKDKRKLQKDEQGLTMWKTRGGSFTTTTTINLCYKLI